MEQHLRNFVVYPFNRSLCLRWAEGADRARRKGRPIGVADAWIAATALEHDIPLITNNATHYAGVDCTPTRRKFRLFQDVAGASIRLI